MYSGRRLGVGRCAMYFVMWYSVAGTVWQVQCSKCRVSAVLDIFGTVVLVQCPQNVHRAPNVNH